MSAYLIAFGIIWLNMNARRLSMPGLAGSKNGERLEAAENAKFDVLLTVDRGIEYQQNFGNRKIAVVILCVKSI